MKSKNQSAPAVIFVIMLIAGIVRSLFINSGFNSESVGVLGFFALIFVTPVVVLSVSDWIKNRLRKI